ncbi:MAG: hypothetical protein L3J89_03035 [Gammaproteobacteria bacterium]|nr:hypothetical protein [Gammaproteobacteria bacterium]
MSKNDATDKAVNNYYQKKTLSAQKLQQLMDVAPTQQQLVENIAQEIAINHQKNLQVSYAALNQVMTKLGFRLIDPKRLNNERI